MQFRHANGGGGAGGGVFLVAVLPGGMGGRHGRFARISSTGSLLLWKGAVMNEREEER